MALEGEHLIASNGRFMRILQLRGGLGFLDLKWSCKFGLRAKMYRAQANVTESDKTRKSSNESKAAVVLDALRGEGRRKRSQPSSNSTKRR